VARIKRAKRATRATADQSPNATPPDHEQQHETYADNRKLANRPTASHMASS